MRYTLSEDVKKELLYQLLELDFRIAGQEEKEAEKQTKDEKRKKVRSSKVKKTRGKKPEEQIGLF